MQTTHRSQLSARHRLHRPHRLRHSSDSVQGDPRLGLSWDPWLLQSRLMSLSSPASISKLFWSARTVSECKQQLHNNKKGTYRFGLHSVLGRWIHSQSSVERGWIHVCQQPWALSSCTLQRIELLCGVGSVIAKNKTSFTSWFLKPKCPPMWKARQWLLFSFFRDYATHLRTWLA